MSDISPINTSVSHRVGRVSVDPSIAANQNNDQVRARGGARNAGRSSDQVEFSRVAQYLSQLQSEPAERSDLVNRVRAEIDAGTYLTEDKLNAAADGLLDDINLEF